MTVHGIPSAAIKQELNECGLSILAFSRLCGINNSRLDLLLKQNKTEVYEKNCLLICKAFGWSPSRFSLPVLRLVPHRIGRIRRAKAMNGAEFAKRIKTTPTTLRKIETTLPTQYLDLHLTIEKEFGYPIYEEFHR